MLYDDDDQNRMPDGDPYELTQTQQATQTQSQTQPEVWNPDVWGKLVPMAATKTMIDFYKTTKIITIGRGTQCKLQLQGAKVSSEHCTIRWDEVHDEVVITDTSRNGTYVSGKLIGKNKSGYLLDGAEIVFGQGGTNLAPNDFCYIFRYNAKTPPEGLYKEYDVGNEIGRGSFATVRKGIRRCDGMDVAIKTIHKSRLQAPNSNREQAFFREVEIMKGLDHPHICKLYQTFHDELSVYLVLEFCTGGDLLEYIVEQGGLNEGIAKNFTFQIVDAMSYVHRNNIAHRDLKPENILLTGGNVLDDSLPNLKIADFGLAKALDGATKFKTMCGTPLYLAPEVVLKNQDDAYTLNVDSWSVGVIVFCMLANAVPFEDDDAAEINERFKDRKPNFKSLAGKGLSETCLDFLMRMLDINPKTRLTCTQALKHSWLWGMKEHNQDIRTMAPEVAESNEQPPSRLQQSGFSMLANAGSYIDAEEAANAAFNDDTAGDLYDDDIARTARSMAKEYSVDESLLPPPSQGTRLERRTMEMFKEDDELGSYQYVTEGTLREASPEEDNDAGPSSDRGNLKRKERSENANEDYEMRRASDNSSDNSMATTPVSGNDNDAQTPTEERNLRPTGGNKRSKC